MIALTAPGGVWIGRAGVACVEGPDSGERAVAPVPGREHGASVITSGHNEAGPLSVEISDARQEAVHAIAVTVAPIADSPARDDVASGGHSRAGLSIEDGQKFRPGEDVARGVAKIGVRVSNYCAHAVNGPVGRLAGDLGLPVAVKIVDLKLRVVSAGANVATEVDAPQPRPTELVSVEVDVARVAGLRIVLRVRGVPFDDDLVLAVAVEIADATVVRAVSVILARRRHARRRNLQGNAQVLPDWGVGSQRERRARRSLEAGDDRTHGVSVRSSQVRAAVNEVGRAIDGRCVEKNGRSSAGRAVEIEGDVRRIGPQHAPAYENLRRRRADCHDAATEILHQRRPGRRLPHASRRRHIGGHYAKVQNAQDGCNFSVFHFTTLKEGSNLSLAALWAAIQRRLRLEMDGMERTRSLGRTAVQLT